MQVRSRGHCGLLCEWEPFCQGFEATVLGNVTMCHMAMQDVDALAVE